MINPSESRKKFSMPPSLVDHDFAEGQHVFHVTWLTRPINSRTQPWPMRDETFNIRMTLRIFCTISYYFTPFMSDFIFNVMLMGFHSWIVRRNFRIYRILSRRPSLARILIHCCLFGVIHHPKKRNCRASVFKVLSSRKLGFFIELPSKGGHFSTVKAAANFF